MSPLQKHYKIKKTLFHLIFFKRCYSIISFYIYCVDCPIFPTKKEACGPIPKPKLSHQSESWGHGSMLQDPQEHRRSVGALQYPQESTLAEEARVTTPRLLGHELPTSYRLRRRWKQGGREADWRGSGDVSRCYMIIEKKQIFRHLRSGEDDRHPLESLSSITPGTGEVGSASWQFYGSK